MGGLNFGDNLMNLSNLHTYFQAWGKMVRPQEIGSFNRYVSRMLRRNRVIILNGEDGMEAILFYFLTDDVSLFNNRPLWSTPEDDENGHTIFIDKMVARKWTKLVRLAVQDAIEKKYPHVETAYWLREPLNRSVIIRRRRELCPTQ